MQPLGERGDYFVKSLILFLSGILAHVLSGGSVVESGRLLALSSLIALCLFLTRRQILEGPELALLVLLLQSSGHFLLGGADKTSDLRMSFAHLGAGFLSYKTVGILDRFWEFFARVADALIVPVFTVLRVEHSYVIEFNNSPINSISRTFITSMCYRGPPTKELA